MSTKSVKNYLTFKFNLKECGLLLPLSNKRLKNRSYQAQKRLFQKVHRRRMKYWQKNLVKINK